MKLLVKRNVTMCKTWQSLLPSVHNGAYPEGFLNLNWVAIFSHHLLDTREPGNINTYSVSGLQANTLFSAHETQPKHTHPFLIEKSKAQAQANIPLLSRVSTSISIRLYINTVLCLSLFYLLLWRIWRCHHTCFIRSTDFQPVVQL